MNWQVQENQIRDIGFKPEVLDRTSKHGEKSSLNLWSATSAGLNVALKKHGLTAFRAQDFRLSFCGDSFLNCFISLFWVGIFVKLLLQQDQPRANRCSKETVVTDFHEAMWKNMLKKTLHEAFHRERTELDLTCI